MNLNEIFKANGVEDAVANAILSAMKENKIYTASEENLDVRYGKLKTDHESKLNELTEANKLIDELKKSNKGNDDFTIYLLTASFLRKRDDILKSLLKRKALNSEYSVGLTHQTPNSFLPI